MEKKRTQKVSAKKFNAILLELNSHLEQFDTALNKFNTSQEKLNTDQEQFDSIMKKFNILPRKLNIIRKELDAAKKELDAIREKSQTNPRKFIAIQKEFDAAHEGFNASCDKFYDYREIFKRHLLANLLNAIEDCFNTEKLEAVSPITPKDVIRCCDIVCEHATSFDRPTMTEKEAIEPATKYNRPLSSVLSILIQAQSLGNDYAQLYAVAAPQLVNEITQISDEDINVVKSVFDKARKLFKYDALEKVEGPLKRSPKTAGHPTDTFRNYYEDQLAALLLAVGLKQRQTARYIEGFMAYCGLQREKVGYESIEQDMIKRKKLNR